MLVWQKLNRLDRGATFISTLRQGQAAAGTERDRRRSVEGCLTFHGWVAGQYPSDCHKASFVKRYQWLFGYESTALFPSAISMDRLTKRSIF